MINTNYLHLLLLFGYILTCCNLNAYTQNTEGIIIDIEGNRYKTIIIGNQEWMAENLKTTKFNDGDGIPLEKDNKTWMETTTPAYCWYNNDFINKDILGALYNWQAVSSGKLCPEGWHVPSDEEWTQMVNYLGGFNIAGGKLKKEGTELWDSPNFGANNESGFTALPGGYRYGYFWGDGKFYEKGLNGYFWTSTEYTETHSVSFTINAQKNKVYRSYFVKNNGFCVRCIKDK